MHIHGKFIKLLEANVVLTIYYNLIKIQKWTIVSFLDNKKIVYFQESALYNDFNEMTKTH